MIIAQLHALSLSLLFYQCCESPKRFVDTSEKRFLCKYIFIKHSILFIFDLSYVLRIRKSLISNIYSVQKKKNPKNVQ